MKIKDSKFFNNYILPSIFGVLVILVILLPCLFSFKFSNPFPINLIKRSGNCISIVEFSDMQNLYFALALGIPGIYLTMLSILLNARQNLSIGIFIKYVKSKFTIFLLTISILLCFLNLIIPYFRPTKWPVFCFQILSIIELFIFAIFAFKTLFFIENPKSCAKLYKKNCFPKTEIDENESRNFYFSFVRPAFQGNSFSVFESIREIQLSNKKKKFFDYEILTNLLKTLEFRKDSEILLNGLKKIAEYITFYSGNICYKKDNSNETLEALQKYEDLYFKFYEQLFFCNAIEYPYILESAQFLRSYLTSHENKIADSKFYNSVCNIYSKILISAKKMTIFSMYKCNSVNVHSHMADFISLSQGLKFNSCEENRNLLKTYEHFSVDILTHLINLIQMQRINNNYLFFVFRGLEHINQIELTDDDFEMYFEILPDANIDNVLYSRNYYITVLLVLCKNKNTDLYTQTFNKLKYKANAFDDLKSLYSLLNRNAKRITEDDLHLINPDKKIIDSLTFVENDINEKLEELKDSKMNSLMKTDVSSELNIAVTELKRKLKENFKAIWKESSEKNNSFYFHFRAEFSVNSLKDGKYNTDCKVLTNLILEVICNQFLENAEKVTVNSINDIPNIKNQKEIFISSTTFDSLVSDKNFNFSGQQIEIDKKTLNIHYFSQNEKCIILLEEIEKTLAITDITDFQDKAEKFIRNDDVIISVLFHLIGEKLSTKGKVYILG